MSTIILERLLSIQSLPGQPLPLFEALDAACQELVGHELFTLLHVDGAEVARVYSSRPEEYPVSGRKTMGQTPWGNLVLKNQQPFLGLDPDAIRWAFYDHPLILGMGLGSVINVPVLYSGETLGTLNLLARERHYRAGHVALLRPFAALLVPAFIAARADLIGSS